MKRYELTKEQWELIKPLPLPLPPPEEMGKRGRPRKDNRTMPNGMLWIVQSGAQWREPPEAYGPWRSVYAQFAKWREKTADKSVDRTRGGLNTKLHTVMDGLGNPVEFLLSAKNDHDSVHAVELLKKVEIRGSGVLTDWAYGARAIRPYISEHGASYVIPPQSNVSDPWPVDWHLYTERGC